MPTKLQQETPPQSEKTPSEQEFQQPFFIKLEQFVAARPQNIENVLKQLRKERIRRLQELRQSQVVVYYSLESLQRRDAERFFEVLTTLNVKIAQPARRCLVNKSKSNFVLIKITNFI